MKYYIRTKAQVREFYDKQEAEKYFEALKALKIVPAKLEHSDMFGRFFVLGVA